MRRVVVTAGRSRRNCCIVFPTPVGDLIRGQPRRPDRRRRRQHPDGVVDAAARRGLPASDRPQRPRGPAGGGPRAGRGGALRESHLSRRPGGDPRLPVRHPVGLGRDAERRRHQLLELEVYLGPPLGRGGRRGLVFAGGRPQLGRHGQLQLLEPERLRHGPGGGAAIGRSGGDTGRRSRPAGSPMQPARRPSTASGRRRPARSLRDRATARRAGISSLPSTCSRATRRARA